MIEKWKKKIRNEIKKNEKVSNSKGQIHSTDALEVNLN
jgi:hypothetical protein